MSVSKKPLNISMGEPMWTLVYEFKTNKIYKAPKGMQDVRFLHTPAMESLCGYEHKAPMNGEDYVVAGMLEGDDVMITSCSFIQPWAQLSPAQRRGLSLTYRKGCNCTIMPCTSVPFEISSNSQCLWTDGLESRVWDGPQAKRMACLPRLNTTDACSWKVLVTQGPGNLRRSLLKQ
uniref:Uncharacterized protein n=2 Tax=Sphaerodactylus townsendi TaxID=933632 RepID=A0ACB8EN27_9SAUR